VDSSNANQLNYVWPPYSLPCNCVIEQSSMADCIGEAFL
jgi:hypothetical protein